MYPLGEAFLHLPASIPSGFIDVQCFYSPHLFPTLVSPCDILKTSMNWQNSFSGQDMKKYFGANGDSHFGGCCFTCHHKLSCSQNIVIDDIVMNGNCYTYPFILPDVDIDHPETTFLIPRTMPLFMMKNTLKIVKLQLYILLMTTVKLPYQLLKNN